jgi:two-component system, cell cycle sensor histidine kinase and response regulator CckA
MLLDELGGRLKKLLGMAKRRLRADVAGRAKDEELLRHSEERFFKAFRSSPLAITISTLTEGRYLDVNDAFLQMMGYTREEVIGRTANELRIWLAPEERATMIRHLTEAGRVAGFETKFKVRSGEIRLTNVSAELIRLDGVACVLAITQDVTEAEHLEEQLRQSQKMEGVGRLAGGIAHDFSNMLSVILGYSELLQEREQPDLAGKYIGEIRTAAERAASLTRQLLAFSRQQALQPRLIDLNDVVDRVSQMLQPVMGDDIELVVTSAPSLGAVKADSLQIEQAVMNLAVNARDAMPAGGKLIIETRAVDLDESFASSSASFRPGPYVMLSVSDTGCGMDEQIMAHIFEPFFTTKPPGEGTGLGLSMVHGCVSQSGGHIWINSEPGGGTTFKIFLPRVDEPLPKKPLEVPGTPIEGCETILLVEDDEPLRKLTTSVLRDKGYTVLTASGGRQAIEVAKEYSGPIDLLISDVVMRGLDGSELAAMLKAFRTDLKVMFISGYPSELISHHGTLESGVALVEKPFTTHSLLSHVRIVLGSD